MDETRLRNLIIGGVTIVVAIAMVALFWILRESNKATLHASAQFATALVRNDPSAAPSGGEDYVKGVRAYFGPVSSARVIDSHNHSVNTGDNADTRSYYVGDVLLRSERGLAVIELEFDNQSLANSSEKISSVHEIAPDKVRRHKLSEGDRHALADAFAARGNKTADRIALSGAFAEVPQPTAPQTTTPPAPTVDRAAQRRQRAGAKKLRCVQAAHGDVIKLQRCV
jgi:hypothetical protein